MNRILHWIDGQAVEGTSGRSGPVFDPATGQQQSAVDFASVGDVDRAVAVAKAAFTGWRSTNLSRRAEVMFRMRELVDANRKEIASLLSKEHGKVLGDALGEVAREEVHGLVPVERVFTPDPALRSTYDAMSVEFRKLFKAQRGLFRRLNSASAVP